MEKAILTAKSLDLGTLEDNIIIYPLLDTPHNANNSIALSLKDIYH